MSKYALKLIAIGAMAKSLRLRVKENRAREKETDLAQFERIPEDRQYDMVAKQMAARGLKATPEAVQRVIQGLKKAKGRSRYPRHERTHVVRKTARHVHLARMFLKGVPYKVVESKTYTRPYWDQVALFAALGGAPLNHWKPEGETGIQRPQGFQQFDNWMKGN